MKNNNEYLHALRQSIPFLNQIPDRVYFQLDPCELYLPVGRVAVLRCNLEQQLNHYVMTYKRKIFASHLSFHNHLCANLKGAPLTKIQKKLLDQYESIVAPLDVSFVIYKKPIEIIDHLPFGPD
jgi:hypothetical protein